MNIDLWETLGTLIDSPVKAFSKIIHAEHKNFIFFLLFLVIVKFFINVFIISSQLFEKELNTNFVNVFLIVAASIIFVIFSFSLLLKTTNSLFGLRSRFKDNLAILIYSQVPHIYAFVFLFTVEIVLFGGYLFTYNPSPYMLKPTPALILTIMELIMVLWCIVLTSAAIYSQSHGKIYSLAMSLLFNLLLIGAVISIIFFI